MKKQLYNIDHIEQLLQRFFEGETSNAEEQELYLFFESEHVPTHLEEYKPLFHFFDSGICGEIENNTPKTKSRRRRLFISFASVAALVAVLFSTHALITSGDETSFNVYEGSYILRNGVRIYDIDAIKEVEASINAQLNKQHEDVQEIIDYVSEKHDQYKLLEQLGN